MTPQAIGVIRNGVALVWVPGGYICPRCKRVTYFAVTRMGSTSGCLGCDGEDAR